MRSALPGLVPRGESGSPSSRSSSSRHLLLPPMLQDPQAQPDILNGSLRPPNASHLLGTDHLSRDVLSRVVHGARVSLAVAAGAVALSVTLGALIGLVAGYAGGWVDAAAMRLVDGAMAVPRLFMLLLIAAVMDHIPLTSAHPGHRMYRVVRNQPIGAGGGAANPATRVRSLSGSARSPSPAHYLPPPASQCARAAGRRDDTRSRRRHSARSRPLIPGTRRATANPFLGRHDPRRQAGYHLAPWTSLAPGVAIVLTVLSVNLVGEALRDALDPRES